MAYLVRRLLENSSNDSFLRQGLAEGLSEEVLLMNPNDHAKDPTPLASLAAPPPGGEGLKTTPSFSPSPPGGGGWGVGSSPGVGQTFQNEPLTDFSIEANRVAM